MIVQLMLLEIINENQIKDYEHATLFERLVLELYYISNKNIDNDAGFTVNGLRFGVVSKS